MMSSKIRYLTIIVTVFMMSCAQAGIITLNVESAGYDSAPAPGFARLNVDGVDLLGGFSTRGVNIAVIDEITGNVISAGGYDTHGSPAAAAALAALINGLSNGRIVMIGVQDEATNALGAAARDAIASLGGSSNNIYSGGYRGSYGLIGIAGAGVNSRIAFESIGPRFASGVSVTDTFLVSVPAPLSALIFISGIALLGLKRAQQA